MPVIFIQLTFNLVSQKRVYYLVTINTGIETCVRKNKIRLYFIKILSFHVACCTGKNKFLSCTSACPQTIKNAFAFYVYNIQDIHNQILFKLSFLISLYATRKLYNACPICIHIKLWDVILKTDRTTFNPLASHRPKVNPKSRVRCSSLPCVVPVWFPDHFTIRSLH